MQLGKYCGYFSNVLTEILFTTEHTQSELCNKLFNASHVLLMFEKHNSIETCNISSLLRLNYTKMLIKTNTFRAFIEAKPSMISSK